MTAETVLFTLALIPSLMWLGMALLPWRPWSTREFLDAGDPGSHDPSPVRESLEDVTIVIPARNEAAVLPETLSAAARQGNDIRIVLVDDGSTDGTAQVAESAAPSNLEIIESGPLPPGWGGKLWALEQGRKRVDTPLTLLLDADIALAPGIVTALRRKMLREGIPFLSLMAVPSFGSIPEKFLMPAFVYFFKVLYPFRLANTPSSKVAAAAGGCILIETRLFEEIGGLERIKEALIDDCTLALEVKRSGHATWLGLTRSVRSVRLYEGMGGIWNMVARTAFTQLRYSVGMLLLCTIAMVLAFWVPVVALAVGSFAIRCLSAGTLALMALTYLPLLRFYGRSPFLSLTLPPVSTLFLAMTWTSAFRYWMGERSRWKGRVYNEGMGVKGNSGRSHSLP